MQKLMLGQLKGPAWDRKRRGSERYVSAMVRVARLLRDQGAALRRAAAEPPPAPAEPPPAPSPTKDEQREMHELQMAQLKADHDVELENLRDTIEELDGLVVSARERALAESQQRCHAVARGKAATSKANDRWKEKVAAMKSSWKEAAIDDVEAAHGS
eukprot:1742704-Prymnesium_polylepis.1